MNLLLLILLSSFTPEVKKEVPVIRHRVAIGMIPRVHRVLKLDLDSEQKADVRQAYHRFLRPRVSDQAHATRINGEIKKWLSNLLEAKYRRYSQIVFQMYLGQGKLFHACDWANVKLNRRQQELLFKIELPSKLLDQARGDIADVRKLALRKVMSESDADWIVGGVYVFRSKTLNEGLPDMLNEPNVEPVKTLGSTFVQRELQMEKQQLAKVRELYKSYRKNKLFTGSLDETWLDLNIDDADADARIPAITAMAMKDAVSVLKGEDQKKRFLEILVQRYLMHGEPQLVVDVMRELKIKVPPNAASTLIESASELEAEAIAVSHLRLQLWFADRLADVIGQSVVNRHSGKPFPMTSITGMSAKMESRIAREFLGRASEDISNPRRRDRLKSVYGE